MTRKEAMEWARKFLRLTGAWTDTEVNNLADLFQEATKGLYRIGQLVEAEDRVTRQWLPATIVAQGNVWQNIREETVRPIREKRQATREELLYNVRAKTGWRNGGEEKFSTETLQSMARDLGIRTEVEVAE